MKSTLLGLDVLLLNIFYQLGYVRVTTQAKIKLYLKGKQMT